MCSLWVTITSLTPSSWLYNNNLQCAEVSTSNFSHPGEKKLDIRTCLMYSGVKNVVPPYLHLRASWPPRAEGPLKNKCIHARAEFMITQPNSMYVECVRVVFHSPAALHKPPLVMLADLSLISRGTETILRGPEEKSQLQACWINAACWIKAILETLNIHCPWWGPLLWCRTQTSLIKLSISSQPTEKLKYSLVVNQDLD